MNAKGGNNIATSRRDNRAAMASLRQAAFEMVPGYAGNAT